MTSRKHIHTHTYVQSKKLAQIFEANSFKQICILIPIHIWRAYFYQAILTLGGTPQFAGDSTYNYIYSLDNVFLILFTSCHK